MKLPVLKCKRCGHEWYPRQPKAPKVCPDCKRYDWNSSQSVNSGRMVETLSEQTA